MPALTFLASISISAMLAGCMQAPQADAPTPDPSRDVVETKAGATLYREAGVDDAMWLELDRPDDAGGPIGGYFTRPENPRDAVVLVLEGANPGGADVRLPHTLETHRSLSWAFVQAGYTTWTPYIPECGIPYGQQDLQDVLALIDWLSGPGKAELNANRLYVVGYSKGATLANLANLQRTATAYVALNGLAQPDAIEDNYILYEFAVTVYPANEGFCQMKTTLDTYGPPGSPAWDVLDVVGRIAELHGPELFVHDIDDPVYPSSSDQTMQARYEQGLAAGEALMPLQFIFLPGADHFAVRTDTATHQQILDYFEQFEPAR